VSGIWILETGTLKLEVDPSSQFSIFSSKFLHRVLIERPQQQFFKTHRR
jgi:hypothetical protein